MDNFTFPDDLDKIKPKTTHMKTEPKSEVFLMDNMELMKQYPDKYFELAIVDPPYTDSYAVMQNLNKDMKGKKTKVGKYHYSSLENAAPKTDYFSELKRVSKHQIIWGGNYFELGPTSCYIIWDKDNSGNFADAELAWTDFKTSVRIFKYRWNGMLQQDMKNKEDRIHPTQKPVALYTWLLQNYAKKGDKILDTHLGSGSSRIAAYKLGFDFVGCEIDKDYYDGNNRFKQAIAEPLFDSVKPTIVQTDFFNDLEQAS